jgi:elongation factor G
VRFEPAEPGAGYAFASQIVGDALPSEYVAAVEKGLALAKEHGPLAGFPVIDFSATLLDADHHDLDSSPRAFEVAARKAFRELRDRAAPMLLEPVMKVEVAAPEDFVGDVISDLVGRRGAIHGADQRADTQVIVVMAPLADMFGYAEALRSMTHGRATFRMVFDHYAPVSTDPDPDLFPPAAAVRA